MERKKLYGSFVLIAVLIASLFVFFKGQKDDHPSSVAQQVVSTTTFQFEVSDTPPKQQKGLSGRASIPANYGMLFVFPKNDRYGFWMKDMLTPIDILWLSDNGTIVGVERAVATSTYPHVFYPSKPVRYVLETRVGEMDAQGWSTGSTLVLPL
ncbi:MAG: DUF192 domain-containing protein [Minisyncoccia bacterium]